MSTDDREVTTGQALRNMLAGSIPVKLTSTPHVGVGDARYERDLKVLERHRKVSTRHSAPGQAWCCGCYGEAPCSDLSDLLDVYPEVTRP